MTPYAQSIINALQEKHDQLANSERSRLMGRRADVETTTRAFDESWSIVEAKHQRGLRDSSSEAWTNSLVNLHAERKQFYGVWVGTERKNIELPCDGLPDRWLTTGGSGFFSLVGELGRKR